MQSSRSRLVLFSAIFSVFEFQTTIGQGSLDVDSCKVGDNQYYFNINCTMPCGYDVHIHLTEDIVIPDSKHMCRGMLIPSTECSNSLNCTYISKIIKQTFTLTNTPYFVIKCIASTKSSDPPPPSSSEMFAYPTNCVASTINSSPITTPPTPPPPTASSPTTSSPTTTSPITTSPTSLPTTTTPTNPSHTDTFPTISSPTTSSPTSLPATTTPTTPSLTTLPPTSSPSISTPSIITPPIASSTDPSLKTLTPLPTAISSTSPFPAAPSITLSPSTPQSSSSNTLDAPVIAVIASSAGAIMLLIAILIVLLILTVVHKKQRNSLRDTSATHTVFANRGSFEMTMNGKNFENSMKA